MSLIPERPTVYVHPLYPSLALIKATAARHNFDVTITENVPPGKAIVLLQHGIDTLNEIPPIRYPKDLPE